MCSSSETRFQPKESFWAGLRDQMGEYRPKASCGQKPDVWVSIFSGILNTVFARSPLHGGICPWHSLTEKCLCCQELSGPRLWPLLVRGVGIAHSQCLAEVLVTGPCLASFRTGLKGHPAPELPGRSAKATCQLLPLSASFSLCGSAFPSPSVGQFLPLWTSFSLSPILPCPLPDRCLSWEPSSNALLYLRVCVQGGKSQPTNLRVEFTAPLYNRMK